MLVKNNYIPQIDGLRAIAVLSVILFHADFQILNISFLGGYFGVDIFFVISGYLITNLIITKNKKTFTGTFNGSYLLLYFCLALLVAHFFFRVYWLISKWYFF